MFLALRFPTPLMDIFCLNRSTLLIFLILSLRMILLLLYSLPFSYLWNFIANLDAMMVLHYRTLRTTGSWWVLSYIFLLLARLFLRLFMSSFSLLVLPPQLTMWHYFVCFVISEAPFLDHRSSDHHFLFRFILILGGLMILTYAAPPQSSIFF